MPESILCVGEVLWDAMPDGLFLGGAPYNVACHLRRLGQPVALVSRVGDDVLGHEVLRRLDAHRLTTDFVQVDSDLPTGFVKVDVDEDGIPAYEIVQPAAWDAIALDDALRDAAANARAVVFGSLAQRAETSRQTVRALSTAGALAVFDVNLRPPFVDRAVVQASLVAADIVKLNEDELEVMSGWFGWPGGMRSAVEALADAFDCRGVCTTRGGEGAVLWHEGAWTEHSGHPATVRDTVGAGDAFLAGLLAALLDECGDEVALDIACHLGAFVASKSGATPDYVVTTLGEVTSFAR